MKTLLQQRDILLQQIQKNELEIGKKIETAYKNLQETIPSKPIKGCKLLRVVRYKDLQTWKIDDNKEVLINYLQYKIVEDSGLTRICEKRTPIEQIAFIKSLYQRICNTQRKYIEIGWHYYPNKKGQRLGRYEHIKITQQQIEKLLQMLDLEID
jgi:hypothetical protein